MSTSIEYNWYLVFSSTEKAIALIPEGRAIRVEVEDQVVCLTRQGSTFYAFEDKCPHQGVPLHKGKCEDGYFICPWHRYAFHLSNGRERNGMCDVLKIFAAKVENDKIYIGIPKRKRGWLGWFT
ncbi:MAG: Rieske (2Fe-2S) protein [Flavobacteriales bacterium]